MKNKCIVLGYGDYGLSVIKDLLKDSSQRGLLSLRSDSVDSSENIQGLRLFHCAGAGEQQNLEEDDGMFPDLYSAIQAFNIRKIQNDNKAIVGAIVEAAKALLKTGATSDVVDVFVVAQFNDSEEIIALDTLLVPIFDELNRLPSFQNEAVTQNLNLVAFYDFNRLNIDDAHGRELKYAMNDSHKGWLSRQASDRSSAFSRIYLSDEFVERGIRSSRARRLQTRAFMQLLLFEELEPSDRLSLLRSGSGDLHSFLASFGVEVAETGLESVSRLVAAKFMGRRLNYLRGNKLTIDGHGRGLDEIRTVKALQRCEAENILAQTNLGESSNAFHAAVTQIESDLLGAMSAGEIDSNLIQYQKRIELAKLVAADNVAANVQELEINLIQPLVSDLRESISADLNSATPIGYVIKLLKDEHNKLTEAEKRHKVERLRLNSFLEQRVNEFKKRYTRFINFRKVHIDAAQSVWAWLLFSTWIAVMLSPSLHYALTRIQLDPAFTNDFLAKVVNNPWSTYLLSVCLVGMPLYFMGRRLIGNSLQKALAWFLHREQGRLADAISGFTARDTHLEALNVSYQRAILVAMKRSLSVNIALLEKRSSEAQWLEKNLIKYDDRHSDSESIHNGSSEEEQCVYSILKGRQVVDNMQELLPTTAVSLTKQGRDESVPSVFSHWTERFQRELLSPLEVIERLSRFYRDTYSNSDTKNYRHIFEQRTQDFFNKVASRLMANIRLSGDQKTYAFMGNDFDVLSEHRSQLISSFGVNETNTVGNPGKLYLVKVITSVQLAE